MSIQKQRTPSRGAGTGGAGTEGQVAGGQESGGQHQGLHRPDDDQRARQALDHAGLDDMGESAEDELGDRGGRGMPGTGDVRSDGNDDEDNEHR